MRLSEFLKEKREKIGVTQEKLAELTGVSTTAIQNWEKGTIPDDKKWKAIIAALNLSGDEFMAALAESTLQQKKQTEPTDAKVPHFPAFLFPEDMSELIQDFSLTKDELELLGWELLLGEDASQYPDEYLCKTTPFRLLQLQDTLKQKLKKDFRTGFHTLNMMQFIVSWAKRHALSNNTFDIRALSGQEYWEMLTFIEDIHCNRYEEKCGRWKYYLQKAIPCLREILRNKGKVTVFSGGERTQWYSLFVENDSLLYPEFTDLIQEARTDKQADILQKNYLRDLELYNQHPAMFDHPPIEPSIEETCVILNDAGRAFCDWYMDNIDPGEAPIS